MTTCAEYQVLYDDAIAKRHTILLSGAVVKIRDGEHEVAYSAANAKGLDRYIEFLADKLALCNGTTRTPRRAIQIVPY